MTKINLRIINLVVIGLIFNFTVPCMGEEDQILSNGLAQIQQVKSDGKDSKETSNEDNLLSASIWLKQFQVGVDSNETFVFSEPDTMELYAEFLEFKIYQIAAKKNYDINDEYGDGLVEVAFNISRDGLIGDLQIISDSLSPGLNETAKNMVREASPFPPLPEEFSGDELSIVIPFEFSHSNLPSSLSFVD